MLFLYRGQSTVPTQYVIWHYFDNHSTTNAPNPHILYSLFKAT